MIAPGLYAILAPIFVAFTVGPRCLMGLLSGAIVSGAMLAIMMSNAGGAWDNSKKLCEKLKIKKTDQGKACVVGDTVGDPFKDSSDIANDDWENWYFGMIPLAVFFIVTVALAF